jgi:two-component system sensor kinase FixL
VSAASPEQHTGPAQDIVEIRRCAPLRLTANLHEDSCVGVWTIAAQAAHARHQVNELNPKPLGSAAILNRLLEIARISALAEMASGIAHELNQPLGAIATFSQAGDRLLNRPEPLVTRALDVFRQINTEALGAGEGIRRIRRLFDQDEITRSRYQMSEVIEELRPVFEMIAEWADVDLEIDVSPSLPEVSIDRLRVQHVLFSLFQNALDVSVQNSVPPRVTLTSRADRYAVETSVTDSGVGISEETRRQLFRPFFTTKPRGTGLGLASSRAIVEAHEGTIGFESETAGGTRFWFRLPITDS